MYFFVNLLTGIFSGLGDRLGHALMAVSIPKLGKFPVVKLKYFGLDKSLPENAKFRACRVDFSDSGRARLAMAASLAPKALQKKSVLKGEFIAQLRSKTPKAKNLAFAPDANAIGCGITLPDQLASRSGVNRYLKSLAYGRQYPRILFGSTWLTRNLVNEDLEAQNSFSVDGLLTTKASDEAGNQSDLSSALIITIDSKCNAPSDLDLVAASDSGSSDSDDLTKVTTPTITGKADAGDTVTLYDTDGKTVLGSGTADGNGMWSITTSDLADGTHRLTARASDQAGNESSVSSVLSITIDSLSPTLKISSSVASLKAGEKATITFEFSEKPGASFTIDDVTVTGGTLSAISGVDKIRTATFTPIANTEIGTAMFSVAADSYIDDAGNGGAGASLQSPTYNTTIPPINLSTIAAGTGGFVVGNTRVFDEIGRSVSGFGDINGDGLDDLLLGTGKPSTVLQQANGKRSGLSYAIFGKTDNRPIDANLVMSVDNGIGSEDGFGIY